MNRPDHSNYHLSDIDKENGVSNSQINSTPKEINDELLFSRKRIQAIMEQFNENFVHSHLKQGCPSYGPLFVLGFSAHARSTATELLSQHSMIEALQDTSFSEELQFLPNMAALDDLPSHIPQKQLTKAGQRFLMTTRQFRPSRKAYFIDSALENFHYIGLIHLMFPHAKIIEVRESPKDACLQFFREAEERGITLSARTLSEYFLQYQELMDHWDELIPDKLLHLNLEDLYASPADQIHRALNHCEIPQDHLILSTLFPTDGESRSLSFTEKVFINSLDKALQGIEEQFRWIKQINA